MCRFCAHCGYWNLALDIPKADILWSGAATYQPPGMMFVEYPAFATRGRPITLSRCPLVTGLALRRPHSGGRAEKQRHGLFDDGSCHDFAIMTKVTVVPPRCFELMFEETTPPSWLAIMRGPSQQTTVYALRQPILCLWRARLMCTKLPTEGKGRQTTNRIGWPGIALSAARSPRPRTRPNWQRLPPQCSDNAGRNCCS